MAFPADVKLVSVTCGTGYDFSGEPIAITLEVTPVLGGSLKRLIHAATGTFMTRDALTFKNDPGSPATFTVPSPAQAETWKDGSGAFFTNWSYSVTVTTRTASGKMQSWIQSFQPIDGQETVDLDLVPDGQIGSPTSAPAPAVTSVNGQSGAVVIDVGAAVTPESVAANLTVDAVDAKLPERLSESALSAAIGESIPPRHRASVATPCEGMARLVDFRGGFYRLAIAGDSTWNDGGDPPRKVLQRLGEITPVGVGMKEKQWSTVTSAYGADIVVKAGATTPDIGGVVLSDNFNRTAAELVGSTSSGGQVWDGSPVGSWSADGAQANSIGAGSLSFDTASKDVTLTSEVSLVSTNTGAQTMIQIHASSTGSTLGNFDVFAQLSVSTTGTPNFSLWKRINGTATQIGTTNYSTGLTNNTTTPQPATVKLQVAIQQVTATITVGGVDTVISGAIAETDVPLIGTWSGLKINAPDGRIKVDSITMETPFTPGTYNGMEFWNAAVPGTKLTYQHERLATMYPVATKFDGLLVTGGHNNGTQTPAEFIAELDAFLTDFKALHPETLIVVASQNPQFPPATTVTAHARRQAALRGYAMEKGYEYLPVFEDWTNQSDQGLQYIQSDGIHPTVSTPTISLNWSGSTLSAASWLGVINSHRQVGISPPITKLP